MHGNGRELAGSSWRLITFMKQWTLILWRRVPDKPRISSAGEHSVDIQTGTGPSHVLSSFIWFSPLLRLFPFPSPNFFAFLRPTNSPRWLTVYLSYDALYSRNRSYRPSNVTMTKFTAVLALLLLPVLSALASEHGPHQARHNARHQELANRAAETNNGTLEKRFSNTKWSWYDGNTGNK